MKHVFISYSRKDIAFVDHLEQDLNARGIITWRDLSGIPPGSPDWHNQIADALENSFAIVTIVTLHSDESRWVARETLYADHIGIPIIPVLPSNYSPKRNLRLILVSAQGIRFDDSTYENGFVRLVAALAKHQSATGHIFLASSTHTSRGSEIRYLDFLLSEMKAELRTARYVSLIAERAASTQRHDFPRKRQEVTGEFQLAFDSLLLAEKVLDDKFDQPSELVDDARRLLLDMPRGILLGEPGSGKTTTLQQLAIDIAYQAKRDPSKPLPVFVPLRSYKGAQPFCEFIKTRLYMLQGAFDDLLVENRLMLLCDALNEMQRIDNNRDLIHEVREFLYGRRPWVVSCRVRDYHEELCDLTDVGKVRLNPLDLPRIKQVVNRRFSEKPTQAKRLWEDLKGNDALFFAWEAFDNAGVIDRFWENRLPDEVWADSSKLNDIEWQQMLDAQNAWKILQRDPRRMMQLCRNPFMLFMVCEAFEQLGSLPPNRGALFAFFVDNLLRREEQNSQDTKRAWLDASIIRRGLAQLAYSMQQNKTGTEIPKEEALTILCEDLNTHDATLLLKLASAANLLEVGDNVRFTHQLLQEYFASELLGKIMDDDLPASQFWLPEDWWRSKGWEETAIILAGVRGDPEVVARWIAPAQPEVAFKALTESGIVLSLADVSLQTREVLIEGARNKTVEEHPVGRATAFRVLGQLHADDRPGIMSPNSIPAIEWCEVFPESHKDELDSRTGNTTEFSEHNLSYTFWIAKYLVTYAQYETFVEAEGYQQREYWTKAGWIWKGEKRHPAYGWNNPRWHISNHPVIGVTWYEAIAFCNWLSKQLGSSISLPTEWEWQKAAKGGNDLLYVWGDVFKSGMANLNEDDCDLSNGYSLGRTSAVGIYTNDKSPYGALDITGNTCEWCLNEYHKPEQQNIEGHASRSLRSGSWYQPEHFSRITSRQREYPDCHNAYIGIRLITRSVTGHD